jgi:hypothetical protein
MGKVRISLENYAWETKNKMTTFFRFNLKDNQEGERNCMRFGMTMTLI